MNVRSFVLVVLAAGTAFAQGSITVGLRLSGLSAGRFVSGSAGGVGSELQISRRGFFVGGAWSLPAGRRLTATFDALDLEGGSLLTLLLALTCPL